MKIEITTRYTDTQLKRKVEVGEVLTVDADRAAVIIGKGFAVEIAEHKAEQSHVPKSEKKHTPKAKKK
jgi:hypothetical protein